MTDKKRGQDAGEIIISGLDDAGSGGEQGGVGEGGNVTPTDRAAERQLQQKPRGEPEDEDG